MLAALVTFAVLFGIVLGFLLLFAAILLIEMDAEKKVNQDNRKRKQLNLTNDYRPASRNQE